VDGENYNNKLSGFVHGNYYKNAVVLYLCVKRIPHSSVSCWKLKAPVADSSW